MQLDLSPQEADVVRRALETYLSDLRHEIVKTERHEWKVGLHDEENTLKRVIESLS